MQKTVMRMVIILLIIGCSSMAQAYSYGFDIQGGNLLLNADDGNDAYLSVVTTDDIVVANPVPVPAAVWLFGSGLIGLVGVRRRMHR